MKRNGTIILLLIILSAVIRAESYRTRIFAPNIKTLIANIEGEKYSLPHLALNGRQVLTVRFDEMSHESKAFSYRVIHCNADWTPSDLSSTEYIEGYTHADITSYERSMNTAYLYTHYQFQLPTSDMRFRLSGNYVVLIYPDNRRDEPVAQLCFSVYDPKVGIEATVRPNTDLEINGRYQQLDFTIQLGGYYVREPLNEIKVVVRQNNRTDNEVSDIQPTAFSANQLTYTTNRALIFEGGSEFRSFDLSSVYAAGRGVEEITLTNQQFEAWLQTDKLRKGAYEFDFDVNGRFLIHHQEAFYDANTEADYLPVHFRLAAPQPFFDGLLYLGGGFNFNLTEQSNRMDYNNTNNYYEKTVLLKQGGYNYQYRFVPKGQTRATVSRTEGSYWQTRNEYTIYVYHRPWGERYDQLVGIKTIADQGTE